MTVEDVAPEPITHTAENTLSVVIVGLVPAIQIASTRRLGEWILGTRPRMTPVGVAASPLARFSDDGRGTTTVGVARPCRSLPPSRISAAKIRDPVRRNLKGHADTPAITGSLPAQERQRGDGTELIPQSDGDSPLARH